MRVLSFLCFKNLARHSLEAIQACFLKLSRLESMFACKFIHLTLFFSYAQIFFQTTQLAQKDLPGDQYFKVFQTIQDIITFQNVFTYNQNDEVLVFIFCCILLYFALLTVILIITVYESYHNTQTKSKINQIWSLLLQIHAPLLFFPINNVCNRIQSEYWNDSLWLFSSGSNNKLAFYCSIIVCLINIFWTAFPYLFVFDILPSHNTLSSKDFFIDKITIFQKLLLSSIQTYFLDTPLVGWFTMLLGVSLSLIRHYWFLYALPRYHFKTLLAELYLINICSLTSLLAAIIFGLNKSFGDNQITFATFITALLFLIPLALIYAYTTSSRILKDIICRPFEGLNPYKAIHKLSALKFIERSMRNPTWRTGIYDSYYFYFSMMRAAPESIISKKNIDTQSDIDLSTKEGHDLIKRKYLETLLAHHNKSDEIKLILARFYTKNLSLYILALKTLKRVKSRFLSIKISARLVEFDIRERVLKQAQNKDQGLDIRDYFTVINMKERLEGSIKRQVEYQNNFWKEYSKNTPDAWELQKLSESIFHQKHRISREWGYLENETHRSYRNLYSLYGFYQFFVNDSLVQGKEMIKKQNLLNARLAEHDNLDNTTLWDNRNFSISIRTHQESLGKIISCSKAIKRSLGYAENEIIGANISTLMSPYIGSRHDSFIRNFIETGHTTFLGKTQHVFVKNRFGALQKVSMWSNVHPFVQQEVLLTGIFRVVSDKREYLFVTPEGEIDSYTADIASALEIPDKKIHISTICPTFGKVCQEQVPVSLSQTNNNENTKLGEKVADSKVISGVVGVIVSKDAGEATRSSFRLSSEVKDCKLEFKPYMNGHNTQAPCRRYECEIRTFNMKESFMTMIEINMHDKRKEMKKRVSNFKVLKQNEDSGQKKGYQEYEVSEEYNIWAQELTPTIDKRLDNNTRDNSKYCSINKEEATVPINLEDDSSKMSANSNPFKKKLWSSEMSKKQQTKMVMPQEGAEHSVTGSSTSTKEKRKNKMDDAFEARYYPRLVRMLIFFLLVIFSTFLSLEMFLQIKINNDLNYTRALAVTLSLAGLRADAFSQIARGARLAYFSIGGFITKDSEFHKTLIDGFIDNLQTNIPILRDTNAVLQFAIRDIDQVFQEKFKSVNIRIYDINADLTLGSSQTFSTFTAINVIIEKVLKVHNYYVTENKFILEDILYILVNCVNDTLEGTLNAITLMQENTDFSFQKILMMVQVWKILYLCLLGLGAVTTCWFLFRIYVMELNLLQQYLGICPRDVELAKERLAYFEKILYSDKIGEASESDLKLPFIFGKEAKTYDRRQLAKIEKIVKKKGLQQVYLKRTITFLLMLAIYMAGQYITLEEISTKIESLRVKISGLTSTQSLSSQISILAYAIGKVLCGDNLGTVRNRDSEEELSADLNTFWKSSYELLDAFTEKDGTYDSLVSPFFFEDPCQFMTPVEISQCKKIVKESKNFGLLSLFARHYSLNLAIYQDFKASNASFSTYSSFVLRLVTNITPSAAVIRRLAQSLIARVQSSLVQLWEKTNAGINGFLTFHPLLLLAVSIIAWIYMLKHFVECSNRFKRMMRIVPFSILVQNPILKGIFIKCSNGKNLRSNIEI